MPTNSTNPSWIEPPPPKRDGLGCFGKSCLAIVIIGLLFLLVLGIGSYSFFSRGSKPAPLPVEDLAPEALSSVRQRVEQFQSNAPLPSPSPVETVEPGETPAPTPAAQSAERQLVVSAAEINGMISANPKSRGHAYVTLNGHTATVQISIPSDKVPNFPRGYLNGSFAITTDGPTPISALQVSKIQANGFPVPSGVLSMSYRGQTILGIALEAIAPYNVSTAEVRDGSVYLH
jgi:hypothetical protein